jgi:hypothetical protein
MHPAPAAWLGAGLHLAIGPQVNDVDLIAE